ncbi:hypothetical protein [Microbacterium sp.]|uniref:hypothetical protein n=1 Tax=Microbacterium sp. TaxID=51671 RepID=UPI0028125AC1|nr:hypothetical protein [Microbacterium sp.]
MTESVSYNPVMPHELDRRWGAQATQMGALRREMSSAQTGALPSSARGAAQTFLDSWETTALHAETASEVYADELRATGTSYENLDAEVARRMAALGGEAR